MAKLDPRIETVRAKYELDASDFWQIPQNKQWVCKHAALEVVATKANVIWSAPQIIQADTGNGIAVLAVTGTMGDRSEWATGEASPKNNKNSYPWAMAEKRAKDRVVLKLVGIHGLVYSEDEMPSQPEHAPKAEKPKKDEETREVYAELERDIRGADSIDALKEVWTGIDWDRLPASWRGNLEAEKNARYRELSQPTQADPKSHLDRLPQGEAA